ncbi:hypothetical protein M0805_001301 [Coniferiporia weirii]|nr:hypothetical protein M0805_001301 [Coniferiporia weirii]
MLMLVLDVVVFACTFYYLVSWLPMPWRKRNIGRPHYPPGPKGLPLVGNIFNMPNIGDLEEAREWAQKHGDLTFFKTLGKPYILVNTYEAAFELFEKRGHNYSSRPQNTLLELGGWARLTSLMPYCDEHRKSRQMLHQFFNQSAVTDFHELQTQVNYRFLLGLLKRPDSFLELTRHAAGETIMMIAYGYKVLERNDPYIDLAEKSIKSVTEAEDFFLINVLPWLRFFPKWFPGTSHKFIKEANALSQAMLYEAHESTKQNIHNGTAKPSMTSKLIESNLTEEGNIVDEDIIVKSTSIAYVAGADTIVSTLNTFCLAMVLYPDVQRRAQEELDRVIGKDNLPTMEDRPNLPYIEAICKESSRWQPVVPLGLAHCAAVDGLYNGYFIPAGTTMLSNVWAMHRDPKEYPEPEKFVPERWLSLDGKKPPLDVGKTAFGFGRRICPGKLFAESSLFIAVASVLAAFNIEKALDANGVPITPAGEYTASFITHPKPFECKITPLSDKIVSTIHHAVESAK